MWDGVIFVVTLQVHFDTSVHWVRCRYGFLFLRWLSNFFWRLGSLLALNFVYYWRTFCLETTLSFSDWNFYFWHLAHWLNFYQFHRGYALLRNFLFHHRDNLNVFFRHFRSWCGWTRSFFVHEGNLSGLYVTLRLSFYNYFLFWGFVFEPCNVFFDSWEATLKTDIGSWVFWYNWVVIPCLLLWSPHLGAISFLLFSKIKLPYFIDYWSIGGCTVPLRILDFRWACHLSCGHHPSILLVASTRRGCFARVNSGGHWTIWILCSFAYFWGYYFSKRFLLRLDTLMLHFLCIKPFLVKQLSAVNRCSFGFGLVYKPPWRWVN